MKIDGKGMVKIDIAWVMKLSIYITRNVSFLELFLPLNKYLAQFNLMSRKLLFFTILYLKKQYINFVIENLIFDRTPINDVQRFPPFFHNI